MYDKPAALPGELGLDMDVWGILEGVDKSSICGEIPCAWDYLRHYGEILAEFKSADINVLELGVALGASLSMWLRYFDKATIIGVDIDEKCAKFSRGRAIVKIGSQDDPVLMDSIASEYPLSLVIDDGSHIAYHIIKSFNLLFPRVLPGGVYIIEDLMFHFGDAPDQVVSVQPTPQFPSEAVFDYFYKFIAAKAAHVTRMKGASAELNEIYANIDSIHVIGGAIIIKKKKSRDLQAYALKFEEKLRAVVAEGRDKYIFMALRYVEFLLTYDHDIGRAIAVANNVLSIDADNPRALNFVYSALSKLGDAAGAEVVRQKLVSMNQAIGMKPMLVLERMKYPHQ